MQANIRVLVLVLMSSLALASWPGASHASSVVQPFSAKSIFGRGPCATECPCNPARVRVLVRAGHTTIKAIGIAVRETAEAVRLAGRPDPGSTSAPRAR